MTANELADKLEKWGVPFKPYIDMLRQQQAEIEALKYRELTDEEIKLEAIGYVVLDMEEAIELMPDEKKASEK